MELVEVCKRCGFEKPQDKYTIFTCPRCGSHRVFYTVGYSDEERMAAEEQRLAERMPLSS